MSTIWITLLVNVAMFIIRWIYDNYVSMSTAGRDKVQRAVSACQALIQVASVKLGIEPDAAMTAEYLEKAKKAKEPRIPWMFGKRPVKAKRRK